MHHFTKNISATVPHVQLKPTTFSVYARTQSEPGRICTVEAIALLLQEYGEHQHVCDALVDMVVKNNDALKKSSEKKKFLWGAGGHPAWYYGDELDEVSFLLPCNSTILTVAIDDRMV